MNNTEAADPVVGVVWQHVGRRFAARRMYRSLSVSGLSCVLEPSLVGLTLPPDRDPGFGLYDLPPQEELPRTLLVCGAGAVCDFLKQARVTDDMRPYWEKYLARDFLDRSCLCLVGHGVGLKPTRAVFLTPGWSGRSVGTYGV